VYSLFTCFKNTWLCDSHDGKRGYYMYAGWGKAVGPPKKRKRKKESRRVFLRVGGWRGCCCIAVGLHCTLHCTCCRTDCLIGWFSNELPQLVLAVPGLVMCLLLKKGGCALMEVLGCYYWINSLSRIMMCVAYLWLWMQTNAFLSPLNLLGSVFLLLEM